MRSQLFQKVYHWTARVQLDKNVPVVAVISNFSDTLLAQWIHHVSHSSIASVLRSAIYLTRSTTLTQSIIVGLLWNNLDFRRWTSFWHQVVGRGLVVNVDNSQIGYLGDRNRNCWNTLKGTL